MSSIKKVIEVTTQLMLSKLEAVELDEKELQNTIAACIADGYSVDAIAYITQDVRAKISNEVNAIKKEYNEMTAAFRKVLDSKSSPARFIPVVKSRNTTPLQDYQDEQMEAIRGSHKDQYDTLRSISEPLQPAA